MCEQGLNKEIMEIEDLAEKIMEIDHLLIMELDNLVKNYKSQIME